MLRALMSNVGSMQKQMDNVSREMESLRKNKEEILEIENTNHGLISGLDAAEEGISGLETYQ